MISYADACRDPHLFGPWFRGESWNTWRVIDKAAFGDPLTEAERVIFKELTGHDAPPPAPVNELWVVAGRRAGKDVKAASIVAYLATVGAQRYGWLNHLSPGERGVVQLLAVDRPQGQVCLGYLKAMFEQPLLKQMVVGEDSTGLTLTNNASIEITTNDRRRVRGRTVIAAVLDECAFWLDEGTVNPSEEVYGALKPAMATIPGAMLIGISSPHARKGLLWTKYKKHWSAPDPTVMVVRAPTWRLNPTLPRDGKFIADAYVEDPARAAAEYGAEFRSDIEEFLSIEAVTAVTAQGVRERAPAQDVAYTAFIDPSGGSQDAMTMAVAHMEDGRAMLDCVREVRPPFSPSSVVQDFAATLRAYGCRAAFGDRYAAEWVVDAFAAEGVTYDSPGMNRSQLYLELLPAINSGRVRLLDHKRLAGQLVALERRTGRSAHDKVDHPPHGQDDLANAAAGALVMAAHGIARRPVEMFVLNIGPRGFGKARRVGSEVAGDG